MRTDLVPGTIGPVHREEPDRTGRGESRDLGDTLAAMVRMVFPTAPMGSWRVDQSGGDHILLVVDNATVFRFPRSETHGLDLEIAVLRALKPTMPVATPAYDYIDPAGRFAGYSYLGGSALSPRRFVALSAGRRDTLVKSAALFLSRLHGLAPDAIAPQECWPRSWTAAQFVARSSAARSPMLADLPPATIAAIAAFYERYESDQPPRLVVVHGDLVPEHILIDDAGRLSGIIDFGDVALGDPAQDFLGFWAYGAATAGRIVELYAPGFADPGLLARSRNHFVRYRLDQLYDNVGNAAFDLPGAAAQIEALLVN